MNNDQNPHGSGGFSPAPFPPYQEGVPLPGTPHTASEQPAKKRGGRRGPRTPKPDKPVKRGRPKGLHRIGKVLKKARTRQAAAIQGMTRVAAPDTGLKISVADAMSILRFLDPDQSEALQQCLLVVAGLSKKSRERVVAALMKVVT